MNGLAAYTSSTASVFPSQGAPENNEVVFGEEETQRGKPRSDFLNRNKRYRACGDDGEPLVTRSDGQKLSNQIKKVPEGVQPSRTRPSLKGLK